MWQNVGFDPHSTSPSITGFSSAVPDLPQAPHQLRRPFGRLWPDRAGRGIQVTTPWGVSYRRPPFAVIKDVRVVGEH